VPVLEHLEPKIRPHLHDNIPALLVVQAQALAQQGINQLWPIRREQRTLVQEETKALSESGPGSSGGPQGGQILCENKRGPRVYSIATKNFSALLEVPVRSSSFHLNPGNDQAHIVRANDAA
jgi:hypothetical protein